MHQMKLGSFDPSECINVFRCRSLIMYGGGSLKAGLLFGALTKCSSIAEPIKSLKYIKATSAGSLIFYRHTVVRSCFDILMEL